jgi:hypothetical protein
MVLMPGAADAQGGALEFDQKNQYYDQLMERALNRGVAASDFVHEIDYYKKVIEKLNNDTVSGVVKQTYMKEVNSMIVAISDKLKEWVDITNKTVDEYYETEVFKDAVKIPVPAEYDSVLSQNLKMLMLAVAASVFAGAFAGAVFVFLKSAVSAGQGKIKSGMAGSN